MKRIMFSDKFHLTKAVLDGRKTMMRTIIPYRLENEYDTWYEDLLYKPLEEQEAYISFQEWALGKSPYKVCEIIAIAQKYKDIVRESAELSDIILDNHGIPEKEYKAGWSNKMFVQSYLMPHHIRITDVRVQRLQDISNEDCLKEGIFKVWDTNMYGIVGKLLTSWINPKDVWAYLIDKISGKGTWESNPWVWVYDFKRLITNI